MREKSKHRLRPAADFRDICPCQEHSRREQTLWRRSMRVVQRATGTMKARGLALLIGIPLALGTFELPTEAMNISGMTTVRNVLIPGAQASLVAPEPPSGGQVLPIFTTRRIREQVLALEETRQQFSSETVRERFFETSIPYGSIIYREARRHNLSPELVAAIVDAESDFRPKLISHKNAQGLMQIVPETGRLMGADDLFNPEENIAAGTKYLRYLFNRFGDPRLVLAAYNAGEGNVEKFGGVPPFPETITYLQRVSTRTNLYRQRFRGTYLATLRLRPPVATH